MSQMNIRPKWEAIQLSKLFAFCYLGAEILQKRKQIPDMYDSSLSVVRWGSVWLKPHWKLVYSQSKSRFSLAALAGEEENIDVEIFPLSERGHQGAPYFRGKAASLILKKTRHTQNQIKKSDVLTQYVAKLALEQGESLLLQRSPDWTKDSANTELLNLRELAAFVDTLLEDAYDLGLKELQSE